MVVVDEVILSRWRLSVAACVDDLPFSTIARSSAPRPVACPQPHKPYSFPKAIFETRSESLCTCPGDQTTRVHVRLTGARLQHPMRTHMCFVAETRGRADPSPPHLTQPDPPLPASLRAARLSQRSSTRLRVHGSDTADQHTWRGASFTLCRRRCGGGSGAAGGGGAASLMRRFLLVGHGVLDAAPEAHAPAAACAAREGMSTRCQSIRRRSQ